MVVPEPAPPVPKMTRFANIIAPFVPCAGIRSAVPRRCGCGCGCYCGCACACNCCGCGCVNWYVPPYSADCCCHTISNRCFQDCGGVYIADVWGHGCHGVSACGYSLGAPAPAGSSAPQQRQMPKVPEPQLEPTSSAQVVIKASAEVRVLVNGQLTRRSGALTTFRTPQLTVGQTYSYEFQAQVVRDGRTVSRTRKVQVRAGAQTVVDFSDLEGTPPTSSRVALITLDVPRDARLFVDGKAFTLLANQRTFTTPALEQGKKQYYELKAQVVRGGEVRTETHKVYVETGKHLRVEFKELAEVRTARK